MSVIASKGESTGLQSSSCIEIGNPQGDDEGALTFPG